ncbi:DUF952 domain-containing protein [Actinomycetospora sp. TBRC 11914]|uniref:DUF952 domain-containing protein n=1 Tax=Actinomycetospora sp. TBRC 11914 TaxID=2729387 RepID=UPI00145F0125|nr:DUF952 domain-containing protein [Actinomycetospora sp. TBRC 11914]NMO88711.1 DUF952 domain-containing protein [Actinomycetospora sp. TBRC 11914]
MILHICPRADWDAAGELLRPASLDSEGFVHCSDPGTVALPASRLYPARTDLVLLEVDPGRLGVPVRWEPGVRDGQVEASGPWFPHVYGPLPRAAVVGVHDFPPEADGTFRLPVSLAER